MYIALGLSALILLLAIGWLVMTVDDWSRDLTTNTAATSPSAKNASLHPIITTLSLDKTTDRIAAAASQLRGWSVIARDESPGEITLRLVRTTRLLQFKDDITVRVRAEISNEQPAGCEITADSKSRIGKGDFGQNPRNLAELMDKVRSNLQ